VLVGSMLLLAPLIYAFTLSGPLVGMVILALVGADTIGTFGVTVVMGQEYLPGRIGVAAGVTMGLSIGLGGVGAPILGAVADGYGLQTMMLALATLPLVGFALALSLPRQLGSNYSS
jgi:FSR family fosmidomycin resistance protein-like MFS transporter